MHLGSRDRVALRGARANGGLGRRVSVRRGSVPSPACVRDTRCTRGFEEGTRRSGTRLRSDARGLRVSVRFTAAARGLLLVALLSREKEIGSRQPASPPPGRPAAAKDASRPAKQAPREWGGKASAGGDRQLTSLCSRVVRVAEVGRPLPGSEKRASVRAGGETSRACVGPA